MNAKVSVKSLGFLWLGGFLYGSSLVVLGVLLTAAGHGTNLLLRIASAPVSFLGFVPSIAGPPILWSAVGAFLPYAGEKPQRLMLPLVLSLHYICLLLIPLVSEDGEWKYLERVWGVNPVAVLVGGGLYLAGQIVIWFCWFKAGRRSVLEKSG